MSTGDKIKRLRMSSGITVSELARRAGLSQGYLSQIETGKATPSVRALAMTAKALDVPLATLLDEYDRALLEGSMSTAPTTEGPEDAAIIRALSRLNREHKRGLMLIIRGIMQAAGVADDNSQ